MGRVNTAIALIALLFSTGAAADLEVYDVDERYRNEVFSALRGVFAARNRSVNGSVEMLPTGQLLVDSSPEGHAQVAAVIEAINSYQAEPTPQVTLRYWAVLGSPAIESEAATPAILTGVLNEITRVHGNLGFRVLGNASLVSESGQSANLEGDPISVNQSTFVQGDTLNANLRVAFSYRYVPGIQVTDQTPAADVFATLAEDAQRVSLNTSLRRGDFIVLGENTIDRETVDQGDLSGTIFYIVHWPSE